MAEVALPDAKVEEIARKGILRLLYPKHVDAVDDVLQNARVQAVRKAAQFDGRSAYGTWFYRIATRKALEYLRHSRTTKARMFEDTEVYGRDGEIVPLAERLMDESPNPEEACLLSERKRLLWEAMICLPKKRREAVAKLLSGGYDKPLTGTEKTAIHHAKRALKELLTEFGMTA